MKRLLPVSCTAFAILLSAAAQAAASGHQREHDQSHRGPAYLSQPDGLSVYSWGYGCTGRSAAERLDLCADHDHDPFCTTMQFRVRPWWVTEGQSVTVTLTITCRPPPATPSILFPGFIVECDRRRGWPVDSGGCARSNGSYTFTASSPGTRAYYSGTQGDLQVEMGLYGAIIVVPSQAPTNGTCPTHSTAAGLNTAGTALVNGGESDFRLSTDGSGLSIGAELLRPRVPVPVFPRWIDIHAQALAR